MEHPLRRSPRRPADQRPRELHSFDPEGSGRGQHLREPAAGGRHCDSDSIGVDLASLLDLYQRVQAGNRVPDDETNPLCGILKLSGVARAEDPLPETPNAWAREAGTPRTPIGGML